MTRNPIEEFRQEVLHIHELVTEHKHGSPLVHLLILLDPRIEEMGIMGSTADVDRLIEMLDQARARVESMRQPIANAVAAVEKHNEERAAAAAATEAANKN